MTYFTLVARGIVILTLNPVLHRHVYSAVNHPGVHGERETKGTVALPKLTSAMLPTAGPPLFPNIPPSKKTAFKTLHQRTRSCKYSQKLYSEWDGRRKHHSIDVDISRGEWRERNRERQQEESCIDWKSGLWVLTRNSYKLLLTGTALTGVSTWKMSWMYVQEGGGGDHNECGLEPAGLMWGCD